MSLRMRKVEEHLKRQVEVFNMNYPTNSTISGLGNTKKELESTK